MSRRPSRAFALVLAGVSVFAAAPAVAAGPLSVRVREAVLRPDGSVRLVVSLAGLPEGVSPDFSVTEAGEPIHGVAAESLLASGTARVAVALLIDVSESTAGRPLADAKTAARRFVSDLPAEIDVALIAFGRRPRVVVPFGRPRPELVAAIRGLRIAGATSLYDAVSLGSRMLDARDGQRNIVLFSDGKDSVSRTTLRAAVAGAKRARVSVTSVALLTRDSGAAALRTLARDTGGRSLRVSDSASLAGAFQNLAQELASQYVLSYTSSRVTPAEIDLSVSVAAGELVATDGLVVPNPRIAPSAGPSLEAPPPRRGVVRAFESRAGLVVGSAAVFLTIVLLLGVLLRPARGDGARLLQQGVRLYGTKDRRRRDDDEAGATVRSRAVALVERVPSARRYGERLQLLLERAGLPLRGSEFVAVQAIAGPVAGFLGMALVGQWWAFPPFLAAGVLAPRMIVAIKVSKRQSAFHEQLPDTLQLLAGSLQAGYGFLQGLDTLVREAHSPTSVEFGRVLAEARLGMPVEEALSAMAERMGSEDFRWVVLAINIQRQVGGNLADLLRTVADTLRERDQVRRQIKVLSAEGRLSAAILTVLPFLIAAYIMVTNRGYLTTMLEATVGRLMLLGAAVLMGLGMVWMRKIVRIEV